MKHSEALPLCCAVPCVCLLCFALQAVDSTAKQLTEELQQKLVAGIKQASGVADESISRVQNLAAQQSANTSSMAGRLEFHSKVSAMLAVGALRSGSLLQRAHTHRNQNTALVADPMALSLTLHRPVLEGTSAVPHECLGRHAGCG